MDYNSKYLKYKSKYLSIKLKNQYGGTDLSIRIPSVDDIESMTLEQLNSLNIPISFFKSEVLLAFIRRKQYLEKVNRIKGGSTGSVGTDFNKSPLCFKPMFNDIISIKKFKPSYDDEKKEELKFTLSTKKYKDCFISLEVKDRTKLYNNLAHIYNRLTGQIHNNIKNPFHITLMKFKYNSIEKDSSVPNMEKVFEDDYFYKKIIELVNELFKKGFYISNKEEYDYFPKSDPMFYVKKFSVLDISEENYKKFIYKIQKYIYQRVNYKIHNKNSSILNKSPINIHYFECDKDGNRFEKSLFLMSKDPKQEMDKTKCSHIFTNGLLHKTLVRYQRYFFEKDFIPHISIFSKNEHEVSFKEDLVNCSCKHIKTSEPHSGGDECLSKKIFDNNLKFDKGEIDIGKYFSLKIIFSKGKANFKTITVDTK